MTPKRQENRAKTHANDRPSPGPFAPARIAHDGPYEHCSILRMIKWRWNLPPMTARDRNARNFAEALDFSKQRAPLHLPAFDPCPPMQCSAADVTRRLTSGRP